MDKLLRYLILLTVLISGASIFSQENNQTFTVIMSPIEGTLDPAFNSNDPDTAFSRAIFDYFLEPLPDSTVGPNLATDWEISDDGLTYTFRMVDNATFHDGTPLTSTDVVWTYNRLRNPAVGSPASNLLGDIATIEAPDNTTVVFYLEQPNAEFLLNLASRWSLIVKEGTTDFSAGNISNVGSGPFILESYLPGLDAVFRKNENYWQPDTPYINQLVIRYESDPQIQVDALLAGEVNFAFKLPIDLAVTLENADNIEVIRKATNQHPVIRLRTDIGPGTDWNVRQAFKLATDRERINEEVLQGFGVVGNNDPIGPAFGDLYPGKQEETYDPQAACQVLEEAGYGSPPVLEMTLHAPEALNYADLAQALKEIWEEGCIYVTIDIEPESTYYAQTWLQVELGITGWGDRPSPQQLLDEAYISTGQFNETRWDNPTLDAKIRQARASIDPEERKAIYKEISDIFAERGPIIIPSFAPMIGAVTDNAENLEMAGFPGLTDYRYVRLR